MSEYYIGLDIGTNSCGYAVTDTNYNVVRVKGKRFWGVRLFDTATTSDERRSFRSSRRRLDRKKLKIQWLNEIFEDEISKIDPAMLSKLKYSSLWEEDKLKMDNRLKSKDSLFFDKGYTDKDYFTEYPTIFHLRRELVVYPAKDVRFLYLAIHSLIKTRGHFLFEGTFEDDGDNKNSIKLLIDNLINYLQELSVETFAEGAVVSNLKQIDELVEKDILNCIKSKQGIKATKQKFYEILNAKSKHEKLIIDTFVSSKVNASSLFDIEDEKIEISFDDEVFETEITKYESFFSEEQINLIRKFKEINSNINLVKILGDNQYICQAMVEKFELHQKQLKVFKKFIKKYYPSKYFDMFRNPFDGEKEKGEVNYAHYSGGTIYNGIKRVLGLNVKTTKEDFYKYVKKVLDTKPENKEVDEDYNAIKSDILEQIEKNNFLPKLRAKENSVFPYQLVRKELKQILKVNSEKFEFLKNIDESGLSNIEKIIQILEFRVPYFIGPIGSRENPDNKFKHWVEKTGEELELKPWTINKIVDFDKTEDKFILNLINKCTYLKTEDVLPKHSLLYSKYRVLNELNKLKINGNDISVELKQKIYTNLFTKNKKVTVKRLIEYLVCEGVISKDDSKSVVISGIDREFANSLASYVDLIRNDTFSAEFIKENIDIFEKIIKYHTIITDKSRLMKRIQKEFEGVFSDAQLKVIKSLNYAGWGSLSYRFLNRLHFVNKNTTTGEVTTVIDELWNTNLNLQQLIFDSNYTLNEELARINDYEFKSLTYEDVQNMYCSPSVKRGVWQTLLVIDEIKKVMGKMPDKIFVEVTREDIDKGDKGRKDSRHKAISDIYNSKEFKQVVSEIGCDLDSLLNELNHKDNDSLRSERLYLYFMQMGKCMYSGESIDIRSITDQNIYDVDHIIPQSIVKDDSISNKVLVKRIYNDNKGDVYPISKNYPNWVSSQKDFWSHLLSLGLMSKSKYDRLIRTKELTDEELSEFIARQLVETNQTSKAVIDLLKTIVDNPRKIVYSKANVVSDFRNTFEIYKSREVNDFHHARDAYLNIVVGNILFNRFTEDPRNFYKREDNPNKMLTKNLIKLFDKKIYNYKHEVIWDKDRDIQKIKDICNRNDVLISKMSYSKTNGAFYDATVYKSSENDKKTEAKVSLKGDENNPLSNIKRYGGYNKLSIGYFMVVESEDKKGKKIKTIESVPVLIYQKYKNDKNKNQKILEYIQKENGLINPKVIVDKLNIQTTFLIDNGEYWLAGKTGSRYIIHNANQWFVNSQITEYVRVLYKYKEKTLLNKFNKTTEDKNNNDTNENGKDIIIVSKASKNGNKEIILTREKNIYLYNEIIKQLKKKFYKDTNIESVSLFMEENKNNFENLSIENQVELLLGVIPRVSTGASYANLEKIGGVKNAGVILINKNITGKNIKAIFRSPTGLFEKVINL